MGATLRKQGFSAIGIAFMLYCLVSAGAFGIEEMIPACGPGMTILLLCLLPFVWAWPISSLVAECNAILPEEGGIYVWVKKAFGEFWGFQAGWWTAISTYVSSGTYIALLAGYFTQIVPLDGTGEFALKVGVVLAFTIINLIGLREVEIVDNVLSVLIVLVFALVAVVGFANWQTSPVTPFIPEDIDLFTSVSEGIGIAIWMYCGYECIATMSGEISDSRSVSRGLKIAMPLIALSYILPTVACLGALPEGSWADWACDGGLDGETMGYASVLTMFLGGSGALVFLVVAIASQCAIFNTYLASGSRSFFVLAEDRLFPQGIAKTDKEGRSPYVGVLTIAVSALIFSQLEFTVLVEMEVVFILATYVILSFAVIRLRKMYPVEERREQGLYVIHGGKVGLAYCAALPAIISVFALLVCGMDYVLYAVCVLATGPVCYYVFKRIYGGLTMLDPHEHPIDYRTHMAPGDVKRILIFAGIAVALIVAELACSGVLGLIGIEL